MNLIELLKTTQTAILLFAIAATPAAAFSLTGTYKGVVACDSTTAGEASTWGWNIELLMVQDGADLRVDYKYVDAAELGNEYTLYSGKAAASADGSVISAYFKSCNASFPADELVRIAPTSTKVKDFGFAADSIWASDQVPNLPGLTVQSCRWSLTRTSADVPTVRTCPAE
ncbi:MAG: hypothetical protein K5905_10765 [Roseibium sp.]|uniref:hypothetical protein n=1 Tax=Roseibium sp. TaxID=1936156 RepID=UPI00262E0212|nr:hypothetical protein [Roseibium sp.]MCV0425946.1 hypothetical protein [Roseibium sp.]